MNLSEFKAWFEGFTEAMDGPPGPKAWKRIQGRVKEIRAEPTPLPQIIREYWPQWRYIPPYWGSVGYSSSAIGLAAQEQQLGNMQLTSANAGSEALTATINSAEDAFKLIGRSDAEAIQ